MHKQYTQIMSRVDMEYGRTASSASSAATITQQPMVKAFEL